MQDDYFFSVDDCHDLMVAFSAQTGTQCTVAQFVNALGRLRKDGAVAELDKLGDANRHVLWVLHPFKWLEPHVQVFMSPGKGE